MKLDVSSKPLSSTGSKAVIVQSNENLIGKIKDSYVFASETCALDIIGAKFIRDVDNGEIVYIENGKLNSIKPFPPKKLDIVFLSTFIFLDQIVFLMVNVHTNIEKD